MMRLLRRALSAIGLVLLLAGPAAAADGEPDPAATRELEQLLEALEDPERRDRLLAALRAALDAERAPPEGAANGAGAEASGLDAGSAIRALRGLAALPRWVHQQVTVPARRDFWLGTGVVGILLPLLVALAARGLLAMLTRTAMRRLREASVPQWRRRVARGAVHGALDALPALGVLVAGLLAVSIFEQSLSSAQIAAFIVQAAALHAAVGVAARLILAPAAPAFRLVAIETETANLLHRWALRLSLVLITGYVLVTVAVPLGASLTIAEGIRVTVALVLTVVALVVIWRVREPVTGWIRGSGTSLARRGIADIWYLFAILYLLLLFGGFITGEDGGFGLLMRATAVTIATLGASVLLVHVSGRVLGQLFSVSPELDLLSPGLRERSTVYRRVATGLVRALVYGVALLVILHAWQFDVIGLVDPDFRGVVVKNGIAILFVIGLGLVVWEVSTAALARLGAREGQQGSRARTLLPLLRRLILISLLVLGGLVILSLLGIDITPLLAGAGVVGLAVGFGSQALVRDFITGLFILIEDSISVGDVVTIGGHTGVVEDLSVRTVRLRDLQGTVHVVPFGDVTSIENFTREFSFAVMDIGVAYREDTDRVCEVLEQVGEELRADPDWAEQILEPLQILGVDQLADSAVVIRCRFRTMPIQQWGVRRAFLRLVKKRFDEQGIEIPFPQTTVHFGPDASPELPGPAPPSAQ